MSFIKFCFIKFWCDPAGVGTGVVAGDSRLDDSSKCLTAREPRAQLFVATQYTNRAAHEPGHAAATLHWFCCYAMRCCYDALLAYSELTLQTCLQGKRATRQ